MTTTIVHAAFVDPYSKPVTAWVQLAEEAQRKRLYALAARYWLFVETVSTSRIRAGNANKARATCLTALQQSTQH